MSSPLSSPEFMDVDSMSPSSSSSTSFHHHHNKKHDQDDTQMMPVQLKQESPTAPPRLNRTSLERHPHLTHIYDTRYTLVPQGHRDRVTFARAANFFLDPVHGPQRMDILIKLQHHQLFTHCTTAYPTRQKIALRHLDHFFTKYAPYRARIGQPITYRVRDPYTGQQTFFEPWHEYQRYLQMYTKTCFDTFCRSSNKFWFGIADDPKRQTVTALCQLNALWMAIAYDVIDWMQVPENFARLRAHQRVYKKLTDEMKKDDDTKHESNTRHHHNKQISGKTKMNKEDYTSFKHVRDHYHKVHL